MQLLWSLAACNISGPWCYLAAPAWQPLVFHEDANRHFEFTRTAASQPNAPWMRAEGVLRADGTLSIDYGCGPNFPCKVNGSVNAACDSITVVGKGHTTFSRHCPPRPVPEPVLPLPRSFASDVAWLANASIFILGSSRQGSVFTPNMQPGGYGGQYTRDYTYSLVHTPWPVTHPPNHFVGLNSRILLGGPSRLNFMLICAIFDESTNPF